MRGLSKEQAIAHMSTQASLVTFHSSFGDSRMKEATAMTAAKTHVASHEVEVDTHGQ